MKLQGSKELNPKANWCWILDHEIFMIRRHLGDILCHIINLTPFCWQYLGRIWFTPYVLNLAILLFLQLKESFYAILQSLTFLGQTHRVIRPLVTHAIVIKRNNFKYISIKILGFTTFSTLKKNLYGSTKTFFDDKSAKMIENPLVF